MTEGAIPAEMDALVADGFVPPRADAPGACMRALRLVRKPVPTPGPGQVLVRVHATSCNPADILYLEGRYGIDRPLPATPGFEAAGVVVAHGSGLIARYQRGRRVVAGGHDCTGTWAQYVVARANQCVPLRSGLSFEQGATAIANPITAIALVDLIVKGGHRAFAQSGAAGALARMITNEARARDIHGVHLVRRAEQRDALVSAGVAPEDVVISSDVGFERALAERCRARGATIALDAVAG